MKFICTIQARMGSERLPGKVLKEAGGKPLLLHQIERVRQSGSVDHIIVTTSTEPQDKEIEEFCLKNQVECFRGAEEDVLDRVASALLPYKGWGHLELVGDSPFIDINLVKELINFFKENKHKYDYVSNGIEITYPNGSEMNLYMVDTLLECNERVSFDDPMREHVDIHIYQSGLYKCKNIEAQGILRRPDLYIEIDTEKDYVVAKHIVDNFFSRNNTSFSLLEIINFLTKNPEIANINRFEERKYWEIKGGKPQL